MGPTSWYFHDNGSSKNIDTLYLLIKHNYFVYLLLQIHPLKREIHTNNINNFSSTLIEETPWLPYQRQAG
jgi:hypothetical protein